MLAELRPVIKAKGPVAGTFSRIMVTDCAVTQGLFDARFFRVGAEQLEDQHADIGVEADRPSVGGRPDEPTGGGKTAEDSVGFPPAGGSLAIHFWQHDAPY